MNDRTLGNSDEQRDLGVLVHRSLRTVGQVTSVVKKAYENWSRRGADHGKVF